MVALIGDIPDNIIEEEYDMRRWRWSPSVKNAKGELVTRALEFYGGPFFFDDGAANSVLPLLFFVLGLPELTHPFGRVIRIQRFDTSFTQTRKRSPGLYCERGSSG